MLQLDKSTLQGLSKAEVEILWRYYSIVLTPILLQEFQTMLAKKPKPKRDWEELLASLANKVSSRGAYLVADSKALVRSNLLGQEVPLDGRIPLSGGKHLRARDGTFGVYFDEPKEMSILRKWALREFSSEQREQAYKIRKENDAVNLELLKGQLKWPYNLPRAKSAIELLDWIERHILSINEDLQFKFISESALNPSEAEMIFKKWKTSKKQFRIFAPYAHYFLKVNLLFLTSLSTGIVPTSKSEKAHLDFEYLLYLPFCFSFSSEDNLVLEMANALKRPGQTIVSRTDLKLDLKTISKFFADNPGYKSDGTGYPPSEISGPTLDIWKSNMRPRAELREAAKEISLNVSARDLIKKLDESVFVDAPNQRFKKNTAPSASLKELSKLFCSEVCEMIQKISPDWKSLQNKFGSEEVSKIFNLHAHLWHPSDNFYGQYFDLKTSPRSKVIYSGGIEPWDIGQQIFRWALYFDQIVIPNPFPSPWARKSEFNPLREPAKYQLDTLKMSFFLVMLEPLIKSEKVVLIPDPMDFDQDLRKK